ncbi:pimeloyl-ACP methyl ester carboxylesterase [Actinocorallia herbida]|uniref:Pimeloyl-ACP methyl ester carboxylesterase n=1 Tax=Actinocorallia herbida TaxID=58109 RepID=A0A3N1D160_9ACTN|nr:alpha/beta hydrolase [Actinocorallia herbida]ROO87254.1 pimeloyl-ACP methyl ester carboxylesterase [Actinocorallia herbida]
MSASDKISRRHALAAGAGALGAGVLASVLGSGPARASALTEDGYWHARVDAAGYCAKTAQVGGVNFSYREGPANGPALLLLHAQQVDWFSYSRVLPDLAASFHVFDVDYQGHGTTTTTVGYPMNANRIGTDLAAFIESVIGGPAYVTGNSSGGLLTTWLAANRPDLVTAAILEDPPLFASEYPRIMKTIAYRDFASSAKGVAQNVQDFLLFWISDNKEFITQNIAPGAVFVLTETIKAKRLLNPGEPVELAIIPDDTVRLFLRGMDHQYDPRFGAAFYDGSWNAGFDHATALADITVPTMLMHANYSWVEGDILYGAMDQNDADKAMSYLPHGIYKRVDAGHVTHLDKPQDFIDTLTGFFTRH